jgi:hypothetical protein
MNKKQLAVMWVGIGIIVLMCLFPPWITNGGIVDYVCLFSNGTISIIGPNYPQTYNYMTAHIDSIRLIIQCAIVGLITGSLLYTLKNKKNKDEQKLNTKQLIVFWIGIGILILMCLFPPWTGETYSYHFILWHPIFFRWGEEIIPARIYTTRLIIQGVIISLIAGGFLITLKDKKLGEMENKTVR